MDDGRLSCLFLWDHYSLRCKCISCAALATSASKPFCFCGEASNDQCWTGGASHTGNAIICCAITGLVLGFTRAQTSARLRETLADWSAIGRNSNLYSAASTVLNSTVQPLEFFGLDTYPPQRHLPASAALTVISSDFIPPLVQLFVLNGLEI